MIGRRKKKAAAKSVKAAAKSAGLGARALRNLRRGRAQQMMSAATAASALPLAGEVWLNHYKGSFANKLMWTPIVLLPGLGVVAAAAVRSERVAKTALPAMSVALVAEGVFGMYLHLRGVYRKPGGFQEPLYNLVMGPPFLAPGSLSLVGGIGLLATAMKREEW